MDALALGQRIGHFRILEKIGEGGMGAVYSAHDELLDRDVAIKVLAAGLFSDDSAIRNFRKEALTISKLNHPNIATVHEFGTQDGIDFLVMEYITGQTLSDRLASGSLPEKEILRFGIQLAEGLMTAHQQRILHRDLKPGNIRITPEGRLKILDFGLARLLPASVESATTESSGLGRIPGTLPYMAPEQLHGEKIDERADIYSAGAVLYEMATGRRPFPETQVAQLVDAILHEDPKPPSDINRHIHEGLDAIILKALDKDAERRYQSARELHVDLQRLALPVTWSSSVAARSRVRPSRKRVVATSIVLFSFLAILLWYVGKSGLWPSNDLPAQKHIAVLPFTNIGSDPANEAFCEGLIETITSKLTQLQQYHGTLWVVPTSEIRKENVNSVRQAQKTFGVTLAITGSVQREADQVHLTANLVDAKTLRQLHAVTVRTEIGDPVLQDGLVHEIASMLELQLHSETKNDLASGRTSVGRTFDLYLQGRGYLGHPERSEDLETAIKRFEESVLLDPKFALAYAGLARAYLHKYSLTGNQQWIEPAHSNARRAVELNNQHSDVRMTLGMILTETGKYEEAISEFEYSIQIDPINFDAHRGLASAYGAIGEFQKAEASYKRAVALQPANPFAYTSLGSFYYSVERYEEAIKMFEEVVRLAPDGFRGYSNLGAIYLVSGRYPEAIGVLEKSLAIRTNSDAYWNLGYTYFLMRRFPEAAKMYEQAAKLKQPENYFIWGGLGDSYYWSAGLREKAPAAYERAITLARQELKMNPRNANALISLAYFYGKQGNKEESMKYLLRAMDRKPDNAHFAFLAALVYNQFGQSNVALDWLEHAAAGGFSMAEIRDRIEFDNLHEHIRFHELMQKNKSTN